MLPDVTTPDIPPLTFRHTLACFATGVTVVTTAMGDGLLEDDGLVHGMTANAFSAVSLDPPLVLLAIACHSHMHQWLQHSERFGISILAQDQVHLARHFAGQHPEQELAVAFERVHGYPLIPGALAYLICKVWQTYEVGDHTLFLGRVEFLHQGRENRAPLLFYRSSYPSLAVIEAERSIP
ncbi:MAG TPA: flavin reductase family protein [Ktedonobacteraceae bacterium]